MKLPENAREFKVLINGQHVDASNHGTNERISPAHDIPVSRIPDGQPVDIHAAVAAAREAFDKGSWPWTSGAERAAIQTTVLDHVAPDACVAREEIFGPVLSIIRFKTIEEAIEIANSTHYGLSAGIYTRDYDTVMHAARRLRAGTVWINTWLQGHQELSFGGYKQSGRGRELGSTAVEEYTEAKSVIFQTGPRASWW